jgi:hypothetical protein
MPSLLPPPISADRRKLCGNCTCEVNFEEACAACPHKKWGPKLCPEPPVGVVQYTTASDTPFPKTVTLASNFLSAVSSEIKARIVGKEELELDEVKRRYAICEGCEFFHTPSKRCKKCGCYLKWKTAWRSQKCPVGKW